MKSLLRYLQLPGNESSQHTTQALLQGINLIQLMIQVASENIDSTHVTENHSYGEPFDIDVMKLTFSSKYILKTRKLEYNR